VQDPVGQLRGAIGESQQQDDRGQSEGEPGGDAAPIAGAQLADGDADLARGRAGEKLAERHQVGIGRIVEPAAALDQFGTEIAQMRHRAAEAGEAQQQKDAKDLGDAVPALLHRRRTPPFGGPVPQVGVTIKAVRRPSSSPWPSGHRPAA
jgi:hypothetical protein